MQEQIQKKQIQIYQTDAFTNKVLGGNPAAVIPLNEYLDKEILQKIALENNLSETAFIVKNQKKTNENKFDYTIRWFTPNTEIELCGHATLASAFVIYNYLDFAQDELVFNTLYKGILKVKKVDQNTFSMNFPAYKIEEFNTVEQKQEYQNILQGLRLDQGQITEIKYTNEDYLIIVKSQEILQNVNPEFTHLLNLKNRGVIVSALSNDENLDFVSRCFYPKCSINEDPTTGSAHCISTPYWSQVLNKKKLVARQISQRVGDLVCELQGNRVEIQGQVALYMIGNIFLN